MKQKSRFINRKCNKISRHKCVRWDIPTVSVCQTIGVSQKRRTFMSCLTSCTITSLRSVNFIELSAQTKHLPLNFYGLWEQQANVSRNNRMAGFNTSAPQWLPLTPQHQVQTHPEQPGSYSARNRRKRSCVFGWRGLMWAFTPVLTSEFLLWVNHFNSAIAPLLRQLSLTLNSYW